MTLAVGKHSGLAALVVGDEAFSVDSLRKALSAHGIHQVLEARDLAEVARHVSDGVALVFVSLTFPQGILPVVALAFRACPSPPIIAVGPALEPEVMFQLVRAGVSGFLRPGLDANALDACLTQAREQPFCWIAATARSLVGRVGLREAQHELRQVMVRHTLAVCEGSRRAAASILGVSRPAVQRVLREAESDSIHHPRYDAEADGPPSSAHAHER